MTRTGIARAANVLFACFLFYTGVAVAGPAGDGFEKADKPLAVNEAGIAASDAVLVSVRGLNFGEIGYGVELKHIRAALYYLAGKDLGVIQQEGLERYLEFLKQTDPYVVEKPLYFPPDYLTEFLKARLPETGRKYELVPFDWSRDWDQSFSQARMLSGWMEQVYAVAAKHNKPVYVLAHSWGSVLMHCVLNRLAARHSPVRVEKFITMGSPLAPGPFWMRAAVDIGLIKELFPLKARKPGNVGRWINLWALRDRVSSDIAAADLNIRVDATADPARAALRKIIDSRLRGQFAGKEAGGKFEEYDAEGMAGISKEEFAARMLAGEQADREKLGDYTQARRELQKLNSTSVWHGAYFSGVQINLKTLDSVYVNDVVREYMLPLLK
ncbi:MAG: alpha/beta hydrolase [Elusimicrobiaceae bacterium]|nr:alpha/beta hydrolase [Elusimicrobiaceae bacterium]